MMDWWNSREPREKTLIRIFGVLLAAAVFIQFLVLPVVRSKAQNEIRNIQAMQTLDAVTSSEVILNRNTSGIAGVSVTTSISELRTAALSLATARGLAISRIQGGNNDEVIMILDNASPEILFAWLADLQIQNGAKPTSISLSGDASGGVRASVAFGGSTN